MDFEEVLRSSQALWMIKHNFENKNIFIFSLLPSNTKERTLFKLFSLLNMQKVKDAAYKKMFERIIRLISL